MSKFFLVGLTAVFVIVIAAQAASMIEQDGGTVINFVLLATSIAGIYGVVKYYRYSSRGSKT